MRIFLLLCLLFAAGDALADSPAEIIAPVAMPIGASSVHFDESARRLYVTAAAAIDIFDDTMQQGPSLPVAQAADIVLALPLRRGYALDAAQGAFVVFDPAGETIINRQAVALDEPMTLAFEPRTTQLAVFGKADALLLDVVGDKAPVTLALGGVTEAAANGSGQLFVINGDNDVAVIEAKTGHIAHWSLPPVCGGAAALALDDRNRRLFVACKQAKLVSLDSDYGRAETMLDLAVPASALAYDGSEGRLFALGGGTLSMIGPDPGGGESAEDFCDTACRAGRAWTCP